MGESLEEAHVPPAGLHPPSRHLREDREQATAGKGGLRPMPISLAAKTLGADAASPLIPLYPLPLPNPAACLLGSTPKICSQTHLVCAVYTATIWAMPPSFLPVASCQPFLLLPAPCPQPDHSAQQPK